MAGYSNLSNPSLKQMAGRLGISNESRYPLNSTDLIQHQKGQILDKGIYSIESGAKRLAVNGGFLQQERMIKDKRRSLNRALFSSYQGADIRNVLEDEDSHPIRALINPDKLKQDYDDKILSVGYEYGFQPGDVFEWLGTKTHWLIYLQDLTELAYFRGDIRKCSYEICWDDDTGRHSTYAAVRGPVETVINSVQKHDISIDTPNYSLNILMPLNEYTQKYFQRYAKFYLQGDSAKVCWRVEATDWISMPGVLEINAQEYYSNEIEDDIENGIAGGLVIKNVEPTPEEAALEDISGDIFIKPRLEYTYICRRNKAVGEWTLDKKYPIKMTVDADNPKKVKIVWDSNYSGQFVLSFGDYSKTVVVESLF